MVNVVKWYKPFIKLPFRDGFYHTFANHLSVINWGWFGFAIELSHDFGVRGLHPWPMWFGKVLTKYILVAKSDDKHRLKMQMSIWKS